jgi:hypothetical protein
MLPEHSKSVLDLVTVNKVIGNDGQEHDVEELLRIAMSRPSSCAPNGVDVVLTKNADIMSFCVTRASSVYNIKNDESIPATIRNNISFIASYVPDWMIVFDVDLASLKEMTPLSEGVITGSIDYYNDQGEPDPVNGQPQLWATFTNIGDITADYVVSVTNLSLPATFEPIDPCSASIEKGETYTCKFSLRPSEGTALPDCNLKLSLKSPNGHIYDSMTVCR